MPIRPMPGFKSFDDARVLIADMATMHIAKKDRLNYADGQDLSGRIVVLFAGFLKGGECPSSLSFTALVRHN